jgi:hypothetical protein
MWSGDQGLNDSLEQTNSPQEPDQYEDKEEEVYAPVVLPFKERTSGGRFYTQEQIDQLITQKQVEAKLEGIEIAFDSHDYDGIRKIESELRSQLTKQKGK